MARLEEIVARLPGTARVDVADWGDHPTFRVNDKNFVFCDQMARNLTFKLPPEDAVAVVATDKATMQAGYGLGRHGWVELRLGTKETAERWKQVEEWVRTSYTLVAPKKLAKAVLAEDAANRA